MPVSMMLFKISSLVAASTGLLELKSIVGFAGSAEVGSDGLVGLKSCIKLQRACTGHAGNELRIPTRLRTAATERLSRITIVLPWRELVRMIPPALLSRLASRAPMFAVDAGQFLPTRRQPASE